MMVEPEIALEHSTDTISNVHSPGTCLGEVCSIHNRTDHRMRSFPQHWRSDRGIMERLCPHGVGHPDPDDFSILSGEDDGVHGCDGCCGEVVNSDPNNTLLRNVALDTAYELINKERSSDYGSIQDNARSFALLLSAMFEDAKPINYPLVMIVAKIARLIQNPDHGDSWIDIVGYGALGYELAGGDDE